MWEGFEQNVGGNIEHIYNNGISSQVVFGIADGDVRGRQPAPPMSV